MYVYTDNGVKIELVEPPLGHGGEGSVYKMKGFDHRVAKIYSKEAAQRRDKIEAMCSISDQVAADPRLERVAWPLGALYLDPDRKQFAGFGMRRIQAECSMADLEEYPSPPKCKATQAEKIDGLIELCEIVQALHEYGQVLGDLNDDNIVRCVDGHIGIVDADSFHARINGKTYPCVFCMPGFIAPEILRSAKGADFASLGPDVFNVNTDNFSLAVHIFKTLMNGVHPYHCIARRVAGKSLPTPVSIDKRVARGESVFFGSVKNCDPPKFAPKLTIFPTELQSCFTLAFKYGDKRPNDRPSPEDWKRRLELYRGQLKQCGKNHGHWYMRSLAACPYCAVENTTAITTTPPKKAVTATKKPAPVKTPLPKPAPKPAPKPTAATVGAIKPKVWWFGLALGTYLLWFLAASAGNWLESIGYLTDFTSQINAMSTQIGYPFCMFIASGLYGFFSTQRTYKSLAAGICASLAGLAIAFVIAAAGSSLGVDLSDIFDIIGVLLAVAVILVAGYLILTHLDTVITIAVVLFVLRFLWYLFFE